ncbi:hypothetical protein M9H77_01442 [Catharanthus roseus]|uniref:Uncharacterized protein n=1 Tax=Catharanthus roseus TaxID=4058 RepID=A0ACC0C5S5_CATRO|nr:hypothetical protein M9H77_01442 [Catharanthus roseus]
MFSVFKLSENRENAECCQGIPHSLSGNKSIRQIAIEIRIAMKFGLRWKSRKIVVVLYYCDGTVYGVVACYVTNEDYPNGGGALEMGKGNMDTNK